MIVLETHLSDIKPFSIGKVRDIYDLSDKLLIIATDRISAFDVVLPTGIPFKGKVLNKISEFWFDFTKDIIKNHLITTNVDEYPDELKKYREILDGKKHDNQKRLRG